MLRAFSKYTCFFPRSPTEEADSGRRGLGWEEGEIFGVRHITTPGVPQVGMHKGRAHLARIPGAPDFPDHRTSKS